jgi:hypothetical protein
MASLIDRYVQTLRGGLAFDPELAERVCAEVEEHLADIVEHEGGGREAERRAIDRMGDPRLLAAGMARAAMPKRIALTWRTVALTALAVFLAMRLRGLLITPDAYEPLAVQLAVAVDRLAFGAALVAGVLGWHATRPGGRWPREVPPLLPAYLCTGALTLSSLAGFGPFVGALLWMGWGAMIAPALAIVAEVVVLAISFRELRDLTRQARMA